MSCGTGPGARPASDWPEVLERASRYGLFKDLVAQIPRSAPLPLPTRSISIAASRGPLDAAAAKRSAGDGEPHRGA
jgi:hypothetical protein